MPDALSGVLQNSHGSTLIMIFAIKIITLLPLTQGYAAMPTANSTRDSKVVFTATEYKSASSHDAFSLNIPI